MCQSVQRKIGVIAIQKHYQQMTERAPSQNVSLKVVSLKVSSFD
jgi:hypothetical protein